MIVADCSVIVRLLLRAEDPSAVDALFEADPDWRCPTLWRAEFASVLRKYERAGRLPEDATSLLVASAEKLLTDATYDVPLMRVMEVSRRSGCSSYDSHYLALADSLGVKLYTYDEGILSRCPRLVRRP